MKKVIIATLFTAFSFTPAISLPLISTPQLIQQEIQKIAPIKTGAAARKVRRQANRQARQQRRIENRTERKANRKARLEKRKTRLENRLAKVKKRLANQ